MDSSLHKGSQMKHGIELNGVANILMLINIIAAGQSVTHIAGHEPITPDMEQYKPIAESSIHVIKLQLDLLERYMIAYAAWVDIAKREASYIPTGPATEPPAWHEVKANPILFPTHRELLKQEKV